MKPARKLMDKLYNEKSGAAINFGNHKRMLDSCNQRMASISERLGQIDDEVPGAQEEREQLRLESEQLVRSIDELRGKSQFWFCDTSSIAGGSWF